MNPEQLQYACDLANRHGDRTDAVQMKCKVGKPCNGRCIPQKSRCAPMGVRSPQATEPTPGVEGQQKPAQEKKKLTTGQKVRLTLGATYLGAYAGAVGYAAYQQHKARNTPEGKERTKQEKEYKEHLNKNPEEEKAYKENIGKAYAKDGPDGAGNAHDAFRDNYHKQKGSPDLKQPKPDKPWHEELGVGEKASPEEVKTAYRNLSKQHHPDVGGDAKKFQSVNEAYKASKRKDSRDRWDAIEAAYHAAQKACSHVSPNFWNV